MTTTLTLADRGRKWLLALSLILITLPGFVGFDLSFFGIRLGRFQPFKVTYMLWLLAQAVWLIRSQGFKLSLSRPARVFWGSLLLMDLALALSLLVEGGGPRGGSIWLALMLGQLGAVLVAYDRRFPVRWMLAGLVGATAVLTFCTAIEYLFPRAPLTLAFLRLVRDDPRWVTSWKLLTAVALAEFTVRALPLILLFSLQAWYFGLAAGALLLLSLVTLEKSSALAMVAIGVAAYRSGFAKKYRRWIAIAGVLAFAALLAIQGPERIIARYVGMFLPRFTDMNSELAIYSEFNKGAQAERLALWSLATQAIAAQPIFGIGLDGMAFRIANRIPPLEKPIGAPVAHAHNLFLELGVSGGLLAMFAFIVVFALYWKLAWTSRPRRWVALLYLAGQFVSLMVDARIYVSWFAITLFWFAAMAWQTQPKEREAQWT